MSGHRESVAPNAPLAGALWPGLAITACILAIGAFVLIALLGHGVGVGGSIWQDQQLWKVTRFTFLQAFLSVLLSTALALPAARALARRQQLPGRRLILIISAVAMVVPTTVAALGLLAVW
ncbi:MAG: thiamine/thiamine pyrophosphate ABC transporter permease ThiP, partial [Alphaproteobacteria bacterium]|nr:thiamine/thiamine pyrophosphate ABC transporter permease ThiP [Alphaproteobacteria bacterium]